MKATKLWFLIVLGAGLLATSTAQAATSTASSAQDGQTATVAESCPGGVTPAVAPTSISRIAPDPGFDWKNTTDVAQLSQHGYAPRRPGQSVAQWVTTEQSSNIIGTLPMWSCPGVTAGLGMGYLQPNSQIWAGNAFETALTSHAYNQSYLQYSVPTILPDHGAKANLAVWAGVGNEQLVQAGTTQDVSATGAITTRAFTEVFPYQPTLVPLGIYVAPGYLVQVEVWTTGPLDGWFEMWFTNSSNFITSTGVLHTKITSPSAIVPDSATWIAERITVNGTPLNLAQWSGTVNLTGQGWDSATGTWWPAGQLPHYDWHMYNGSTQIAYPAAWLDPPTYSDFPVYRTSAS